MALLQIGLIKVTVLPINYERVLVMKLLTFTGQRQNNGDKNYWRVL